MTAVWLKNSLSCEAAGTKSYLPGPKQDNLPPAPPTPWSLEPAFMREGCRRGTGATLYGRNLEEFPRTAKLG
jgi:hypothetical protein